MFCWCLVLYGLIIFIGFERNFFLRRMRLYVCILVHSPCIDKATANIKLLEFHKLSWKIPWISLKMLWKLLECWPLKGVRTNAMGNISHTSNFWPNLCNAKSSLTDVSMISDGAGEVVLPGQTDDVRVSEQDGACSPHHPPAAWMVRLNLPLSLYCNGDLWCKTSKVTYLTGLYQM